jgi:hypothetical protein
MSVPPMVTITSSIGVMARLPDVECEELVAFVVVSGVEDPARQSNDDIVRGVRVLPLEPLPPNTRTPAPNSSARPTYRADQNAASLSVGTCALRT